LDLHLEVFIPKKKKEIVVATIVGWGVIEYLQLDEMDDETNGWMEKVSQQMSKFKHHISTQT
jgi:hypothetical protein